MLSLSPQFVNPISTSKANTQLFFVEKMKESFALDSHIFETKNYSVFVILPFLKNFNEALTNDIVNFEQLAAECIIKPLPIEQSLPLSFFFRMILILDWLAISLSGVVVSLSRALASILVVCQSISLNSRISPSTSFLIRDCRRSVNKFQLGVRLCTFTLDSWR